MNKLLEGIRVVELGTNIAVPIATKMMADWGADVIKVESLEGDSFRVSGKLFGMPNAPDNNPLFHTANINKKSFAVNLKTPEGKEALMKLLATADVFTTNTRPEPLTKLGFDYEILKEKFPKLIYAYFSAYGPKGPDKDRPGYDIAAFWARGGMPVQWTVKESIPFKPTPAFGDSTAGTILLAGIMAALYRRDKTNKGGKIDSSLFGSALWYNTVGVIQGQPQYDYKYPRSKYEGNGPFAVLYQTRDGDWMMFNMKGYDQLAQDYLKLFNLEQYTNDLRFTSMVGSRNHLSEVMPILQEAILKIDTKTLIEGLNAIDAVYEKVSNPRDLYRDEQAWANGYLTKLTLENGSEVVFPTNPIQFDGMQVEYKLAPQIGADSVDILKSLGYSDAQIVNMKEKKVIG